MNTDLVKKICSLARAYPPSEHVPYAFEKRVMAALRSRVLPDPVTVWARWLWRSVAPCLALTILLGFYAAQQPERAQVSAPSMAPSEAAELTLEDALLAPIREEVSLALAW